MFILVTLYQFPIIFKGVVMRHVAMVVEFITTFTYGYVVSSIPLMWSVLSTTLCDTPPFRII
jgi:nucleosome binding factor SPN SPT16 subunit